jgi:uroporphyrinogen decarboxylase
MNVRENALAVLRYQPWDRLPIVHFGFWEETLALWADQGHITAAEAAGWADANEYDDAIGAKLGFDCTWAPPCAPVTNVFPPFEEAVVADLGGGVRHVRDDQGVTTLRVEGAGSIPHEVDHLLKDRASWEEHYLPRLQPDPARVDVAGLKARRAAHPDLPLGLYCGSLFGTIRVWIGLVEVSYLYADDEALYSEIIDTVGNLCFETTRLALEALPGLFDYAHFWEDLSFKNGPLVAPRVFADKVGPHYRRITSLLRDHGIDLVSVDSDGCIDALVPIWLENGVNTMFPIEVGTWGGSIAGFRETFGHAVRGVGGMNKNVFARDRAAVDAEIDRLADLIALGGYLPCPDHRIAPDAKWDNVVYYTTRLRERFASA